MPYVRLDPPKEVHILINMILNQFVQYRQFSLWTLGVSVFLASLLPSPFPPPLFTTLLMIGVMNVKICQISYCESKHIPKPEGAHCNTLNPTCS